MATKTNNLQTEVNQLKYENESIKGALNQILTEYADYRKECDEICKEYEETIQLLSDSLEQFKAENSKLNNENSQLSNEKEKMKVDQDKMQKELEKAREKNRDKIKDIEILNNKIDELQSQFKSINKKETTLKSKVVTLETDNDHYLNKIHQYEEEVTDLKDNLENTIENLITTQNDFEEYKIKKEEELQRLKSKLQEEKDNVKALMKKKLISKNNKLKIPQQNEDNNTNSEDEEEHVSERKLSWNENENEKVRLRGKNPRANRNNYYNNEKKINKKEMETEQEIMLEKGMGRSGRAQTMVIGSYKFGEVLSKIRKKREELAKLNKKIKKDTAKLKYK